MVFLEALIFFHLLRELFRGASQLFLSSAALVGGAARPAEAALQEAGLQEASASASLPAPFRFEPGAEVPALWIPRAERLEYRAYLDTGIFSAHVGKVTQT